MLWKLCHNIFEEDIYSMRTIVPNLCFPLKVMEIHDAKAKAKAKLVANVSPPPHPKKWMNNHQYYKIAFPSMIHIIYLTVFLFSYSFRYSIRSLFRTFNHHDQNDVDKQNHLLCNSSVHLFRVGVPATSVLITECRNSSNSNSSSSHKSQP